MEKVIKKKDKQHLPDQPQAENVRPLELMAPQRMGPRKVLKRRGGGGRKRSIKNEGKK